MCYFCDLYKKYSQIIILCGLGVELSRSALLFKRQHGFAIFISKTPSYAWAMGHHLSQFGCLNDFYLHSIVCVSLLAFQRCAICGVWPNHCIVMDLESKRHWRCEPRRRVGGDGREMVGTGGNLVGIGGNMWERVGTCVWSWCEHSHGSYSVLHVTFVINQKQVSVQAVTELGLNALGPFVSN